MRQKRSTLVSATYHHWRTSPVNINPSRHSANFSAGPPEAAGARPASSSMLADPNPTPDIGM